MKLFHISETAGITRFEPRVPSQGSAGVNDAVVWAVSERLLHTYLLPRDCQRVTFYALPDSAPTDVERLIAGSSARYVVAIESAWLARVQQTHLYQYRFAPDTFVPVDVGAGYFVSRAAVAPLSVTMIDDVLGALTACDVELRLMPSLWKLHDLAAASSLHFSIIRMRNACPRMGEARRKKKDPRKT